MPIDLEALGLDSFSGRPVAVLGLARTGVALCRFLADRGAIITAYDVRREDELADAVDRLGDRPMRLLAGPDLDPASALAGQDLVCTSPSVSSRYPTTEPRLAAALRAVEAAGEIPVVSEMELFLRLSTAVVVGVTGTKGKTTTANLCAAVLGQGHKPVLLGGNTGTPLIELVPKLTPEHRVVLELSDLQLATLSRGTAVSVYTNVTFDHLDRHGSIGAYQAVKRRLAELAPADGHIVLNAMDPVSSGFASVSAARAVFYGGEVPGRADIGVAGGWVVANRGQLPLVPVDEIRLRGEHNLANVLAAVAVGMLFGIPTAGIRRAIASFQSIENRLEPVLRLDNVLFVNDTQATQPDATIAALRSYRSPIVLICGGVDKRLPMDELALEIAAAAWAVVVMGETGPRLAALIRAAGGSRVEAQPDMERAVRRAFALARRAFALAACAPTAARTTAATESAQAIVLLSPAAAGYELLAPHSVRGAEFKRAVLRLAAERPGRASAPTDEPSAASSGRRRPVAAPARSAD